jgi:uridine phosphorylase
MKQQIPESELILNKDGSIYHLSLLPSDLSDIIVTVGDPERVPAISKYFQKIEIKKQKREFITHTGYYNNTRITVLSTGIGTDNIDIVMNELDALVNVDLTTRMIKPEKKKLKIIRVGTSGALQENIPLNSIIISSMAVGLEGLMNFYDYQEEKRDMKVKEQMIQTLSPEFSFLDPYIVRGSEELEHQIGKDMIKGFTATCQGFYAPQGRSLRFTASNNILEKLKLFNADDLRITNFEMETAGILGMAKVLGHEACSVSLILANRITNQFSDQPEEEMEALIRHLLERIALL